MADNGTAPATKADLGKVEGVLRGDLGKVEGALREDLGKVEGALRGDLHKFKGDLEDKIEILGAKMDIRMGNFENTVEKMQASIERIERNLENLAITMEKGFRSLREADDNILSCLIAVDNRLTGKVKNHEKRIVRLESMAA